MTLNERRNFVENIGRAGFGGLIIGLVELLLIMLTNIPLEAKGFGSVVSAYQIQFVFAAIFIFGGACLFVISIVTAPYLVAFGKTEDIKGRMTKFRQRMGMSDEEMLANIVNETSWDGIPISIEAVNLRAVRNYIKEKLDEERDRLCKTGYPKEPWLCKLPVLKVILVPKMS